MKKIIILVAILFPLTVGAYLTKVDYRIFSVGYYDILRFVDPDNGNICYITQKCGYACGGISCVKP